MWRITGWFVVMPSASRRHHVRDPAARPFPTRWLATLARSPCLVATAETRVSGPRVSQPAQPQCDAPASVTGGVEALTSPTRRAPQGGPTLRTGGSTTCSAALSSLAPSATRPPDRRAEIRDHIFGVTDRADKSLRAPREIRPISTRCRGLEYTGLVSQGPARRRVSRRSRRTGLGRRRSRWRGGALPARRSRHLLRSP